LIWGIYAHFFPPTPESPDLLQFKYFLLKSDALVDFAKGDSSVLKSLQVKHPRVIQTGLTKSVLDQSSEEIIRTEGRKIVDAMFLAITNVGERQAKTVILQGKGNFPNLRFFNPKETSFLCVKARFLRTGTQKEPVEKVVFVDLKGEREEYTLDGLPNEREMRPILGKKPDILFGYVPTAKRK
jgi:hypothetical protein